LLSHQEMVAFKARNYPSFPSTFDSGGVGARGVGEGEADEDPEEEQQRKKIGKRQGYRPGL
jgi:hypothetical protein